jgi:comEA protein
MPDLKSTDAVGDLPTVPKRSISSPIIGWISLAGLALLLAGVQAWQSNRPTEFVQSNRFRVDVNTASQAELMALPELGPQTAMSIVEYRNQHGPFQTIDQLLRVPGIGNATLKQIRSMVTVDPPVQDDALAQN